MVHPNPAGRGLVPAGKRLQVIHRGFVAMRKKDPFLFVVLPLLIFLSAALAAAAEAPPAKDKIVRGSHGLSKAGNTTLPLNMVLVPKGDVVMGMNKDLVEKLGQGQVQMVRPLSASMPKHNVRGVSAFYCDKYEVTNIQWKVYLYATGQEPSDLLKRFAWSKGPDGGAQFPEGQEKFPIRNVDLKEAKAFARWCGKRIPTEAEWMRAAAGDDGRAYSWGAEWNKKLCKNKRNTLIAVGGYPDGASPFGILDMTGSVWEWTASPYAAFDRFKPITMKIGKKKEKIYPNFNPANFVTKGGCYFLGETENMLAVREGVRSDTNMDTLGFRCVKSPTPGEDLFEAARKDLHSSYLKDKKWDKKNFYHIEETSLDRSMEVVTGFDYFLFAPVTGLLTSISKLKKDSVKEEYFPVGIISLSFSLEEPNLPPGSYTIVYRHQGVDKKKEEVVEEEKKEEEEEKPAETEEGGEKPEEEGEKTPEEIAREEEEKRIAEENRIAKEKADRENERARRDLERIGAVMDAKDNIEFPKEKNLILFLNPSDTVVGYLDIGEFKDGPETPIRILHVGATRMTDIEVSIRILGSKHPRFHIPIKIRNNPFLPPPPPPAPVPPTAPGGGE